MAVSAGYDRTGGRTWGARDYQEASRSPWPPWCSQVRCRSRSPWWLFPGSIDCRRPSGSIPTLAIGRGQHPLAVRFFQCRLRGEPILSAALRASGSTWTPLSISGGVDVMNVPLLYVFVLVTTDFRRMGVARRGCGRRACFHRRWRDARRPVEQKFRVRHVSGGWWRKARFAVLDIGYPAALEQAVFSARFFHLPDADRKLYGTEAFCAYRHRVNVLQVCMTVGFGFPLPGPRWLSSTWVRT